MPRMTNDAWRRRLDVLRARLPPREHAVEVTYDRDSKIGKLDTDWDEALETGWIIAIIKDDWIEVLPCEE
jgi:hypothetical protein